MLVLTLDAGGTNFSFSAIENGLQIGESFTLPSNAHDLELCLASIKKGFTQLTESSTNPPDAISFAFPGPADYKHGVIGDLPNLPAFKGGIPLAAILEHEFGVPVYINNDGDLFALGESRSGFLPYINKLLENAGTPKEYKNLIGITLGTGFGVGICVGGELLQGDNGIASEGWLLRNKLYNYTNIEDTVSIRAVKKMYAEQIAMDPGKAPEPKEIYEIALGKAEGVREAALEAYFRFGEALGDALAHIVTLIDAPVVLGGGLNGAYPVFSKSVLDEMNGFFHALNGKHISRLIQKVFNIEDEYQRTLFVAPGIRMVTVPGTDIEIPYEEERKIGIGVSRLGTNKAISLGAYYYAVNMLTKEN